MYVCGAAGEEVNDPTKKETAMLEPRGLLPTIG
jgi:hypothetical protein